MNDPLTTDDLRRYRHQIAYVPFDRSAQEIFSRSSLLISELNGVGSTLAFRMAAMGLGRLGIIDDEIVCEEDLFAQSMFVCSDIGRLRRERAREILMDLNPKLTLEIFSYTEKERTLPELFAEYDLIADAASSFKQRYTINDACLIASRENLHVSITGSEGRLGLFCNSDGPCYRCLFPIEPSAEIEKSLRESGHPGFMPGLMGEMAAMEIAQRIIHHGDDREESGSGDIEAIAPGRLRIFNARGFFATELYFDRNPQCSSCSSRKNLIKRFQQTSSFARKKRVSPLEARSDEIRVTELRELIASSNPPILLDVRERGEAEISVLQGSLHALPSEIDAQMLELDRKKLIVVYCKDGDRSSLVVEMLRENGFSGARNLIGGINQWAREIDPQMPIY